MLDAELVRVAFKNLRSQGLRSGLTLLGVVIGIGSIVAFVSLGNGLNVAIQEQFEQLGTDFVFVVPGSFSGTTGGPQIVGAEEAVITDSDISRMERTLGVEEVVPLYISFATISKGSETRPATIGAWDPKKGDVFVSSEFFKMKDGRFPVDNEVFVAVVGENFAEDAFSREIKTRSFIEINGQRFKVVGVMARESQTIGGGGPNSGDSIFLTEDGFRQTFPGVAPLEVIVKTESPDLVPFVEERIQRDLDRKYGDDAFTVITIEQILEQTQAVLGVVSLVLVSIAAISLVVGGVGIMNAMVMTVLERTKEIGVMKAIGATNETILAIFLTEAGFIGFVGGGLGLLLGMGGSTLVSALAQSSGLNLIAAIDPVQVGGILAFSILVGVISGFYPARRAANLDPVVALRYE